MSGVARQLAEPLRERVVHPEPSLAVDLAGGVAALDEEPNGVLGALVRRHARRADADPGHRRGTLAERRRPARKLRPTAVLR